MIYALLLTVALSQPTLAADRVASARQVDHQFDEHSKIQFSANAGKVPDGTEVDVAWNVVSDEIQYAEVKRTPYSGDPASTLYVWAPPGDYVIFANVFTRLPDGERRVTELKLRFRVLPRGPPPQPTPPDPTDEAPFVSPGLAVLILREASGDQLPAAQQAIFTDPEVLRFASQCVTVPGGSDRFFRIWDDDYSADRLRGVPEALRAAYTRVKAQATEIPWIAISTGTGGYSGPLPGTVAETLELLRRYQ